MLSPPRRAGWYWVKSKMQKVEEVVLYKPTGASTGRVHTVSGQSHTIGDSAYGDPSTVWYGPIEPPSAMSRAEDQRRLMQNPVEAG
jgi:hypothetical protein